jgi:type II secretion system protein E
MIKKKFQDILLELNLITKDQLQISQAESVQVGKSLSAILIEKKLVSKTEIAKALAQEVGFVYVDKITEQMVNTDLLSKIPLKFLRQHVIIPILFEGFKTVVTSNPQDIQPIDDISLLLSGDVKYGVSTDDIINAAINKYYPLETSKEMMEELKEEEAGEIDLTTVEERDILEMAQEAPIVKLVNHIIFQAVKEDASDIHIEAFEKELRVRYRIDGVMYQRVLPPKRYQGAIVSRVKIMANLDIAEKRLPQDGRIQIKVGDKAIDIRVSVLPCNYGERVVMRLLDKTKGAVDLEHLDFAPRDYEVISRNIIRPNGIVLISGPTGSGKTTTLYSILSKLNTPDINIITVEDPVEYTIAGVNQVQVKEDIGLTFAGALRSILRQDPDVILIGEIRDKETAQIATQAALTGHIVLSTIHTNSSPATITRLIDMGVEPFLISSSVICIASQRLVRKLCDKCKQEYKPEADMIKRLGLPETELNQIKFYKPVGCGECFNTGYKGRLGIFEVMEVDEEIAHLIVERVDANVIKAKAIEKGMITLAQDGIRRVKNGQTSLDEVLTAAYINQGTE